MLVVGNGSDHWNICNGLQVPAFDDLGIEVFSTQDEYRGRQQAQENGQSKVDDFIGRYGVGVRISPVQYAVAGNIRGKSDLRFRLLLQKKHIEVLIELMLALYVDEVPFRRWKSCQLLFHRTHLSPDLHKIQTGLFDGRSNIGLQELLHGNDLRLNGSDLRVSILQRG